MKHCEHVISEGPLARKSVCLGVQIIGAPKHLKNIPNEALMYVRAYVRFGVLLAALLGYTLLFWDICPWFDTPLF